MHWHPLRFRPIYKERIWGGRALASLYGRDLPGTAPIGESWEITDRPEGVSVVAEGPLAGRTLTDLVRADPAGLLGDAPARAGRFPLLVKILDARDILSLQVHPPASLAAGLGGEPKTEMWYFTATEPGARILAGLRPGATRDEFERRLGDGSVGECFHSLPVRPGDSMFLPSGRVHALGAGLVLFEIQESSDTTYRVFDWNRVGLDGKPRDLHVRESLASIDFSDFAPPLIGSSWGASAEGGERRQLVRDALFGVEARRAPAGATGVAELRRCRVLGVARGALELAGAGGACRCRAGDFVLLPAALGRVTWRAEAESEWLVAEPGGGR